MLYNRAKQPREALRIDLAEVARYSKLIERHEAKGNGEKARRVIGPLLEKHKQYANSAMLRLKLTESQAWKLYGPQDAR